MAKKCLVPYIGNPGVSTNGIEFSATYIDTNTGLCDLQYGDSVLFSEFTNYTAEEFKDLLETKILAYATAQSYSINSTDIIWLIETVTN